MKQNEIETVERTKNFYSIWFKSTIASMINTLIKKKNHCFSNGKTTLQSYSGSIIKHKTIDKTHKKDCFLIEKHI